MCSNVIDYFATLGRHALVCKSLQGLCTTDKMTPNQIWNEAITDIAVLYEGEVLPDDGWELIDKSVGRSSLSMKYSIAVKRRSASQRLDHITKIKVVKVGDVIPAGFELIERTISDRMPGYLTDIGTIAIKRAATSDVMFVKGEPFVDDICFVMLSEGEEVPEGYVSLERQSTSSSSNKSKPTPRKGGPPAGAPIDATILAFHQRPAMGLCDLGYESATLDRYPEQDHEDFPLPVNELPMFAFPHDLRLKFSSTIRFPLPVFFTFVFTDARGLHMYAACLRFYEVVPREELEGVFREVYGDQQNLMILPSTAVFCPKTICVISRIPFYRAMRRYLRQIYSMSLSSLMCPLEYFIASLVGQVPLPVAGGRPFQVVQDAALISRSSRPMHPIEFELPLARFFPPMDLDFAAPLRCLSVDKLLALFALLLREAKLVFLCSSNTLLTETMETMRSLLFPLKWSSCFVSRLPDALAGLLEAPGGFMIGFHMFENADNDVEIAQSSVYKQFGDHKSIRQVQWSHSLIPGTYIVDLTANEIFQFDEECEETALTASQIQQLAHSLPLGPRKRLQKKLEKIAAEYHIGPQPAGLELFDSAFDFQPMEEGPVSPQMWEKFPTLEVRDSFMAFMADLLGCYQKYIIPPSEDMSADTYRTFQEEFAVEEYLADADSSLRPTLQYLVQTQMFAVLLQQRSEASDYSLVFFESAAEVMRETGLSACGPTAKISAFSSNVSELSVPLYKLLAAKTWAAAAAAASATAAMRFSSICSNSHGDFRNTGRGSEDGSYSPTALSGHGLGESVHSPRDCSSPSANILISQIQAQAPADPPPRNIAESSNSSSNNNNNSSSSSSMFSSLRGGGTAPAASGGSSGHSSFFSSMSMLGNRDRDREQTKGILDTNSVHSIHSSNAGGSVVSATPPAHPSSSSSAANNNTPAAVLTRLLEAVQEMELECNLTPIPLSENAKPGSVNSRDELDVQRYLHLHDRSLGPLIIPGPSRSLVRPPLQFSSLPTMGTMGNRASPVTTVLQSLVVQQQSVSSSSSSILMTSAAMSVTLASTSVTPLSKPVHAAARNRAGVIVIDETASVDTESSEATSEESLHLGAFQNPHHSNSIRDFATHAIDDANNIDGTGIIGSSGIDFSLQDLLDEEFEKEVQRDAEGLFSYQSGWPQLNPILLKKARSSVHKRLRGLRRARKFALEKVNRNILLFLRTPAEQWLAYYKSFHAGTHGLSCGTAVAMSSSSSSGHGLGITVTRGIAASDTMKSPLSRSATQQHHKSSNQLQNLLGTSSSSSSSDSVATVESQAVLGAVIDALSVSITLLCSRIILQKRPLCDMLQVLGILAHTDSLGILTRFDECIFRSILTACACCGGTLMRRIACVVFDTARICGISPDALTYGAYTRALAASKQFHTGDPLGDQVDQFLFLEEMGLTWFQQRSFVIEEAQNAADTAKRKKSTWSSLFGSSKSKMSKIDLNRIDEKNLGVTGASVASTAVAASMALKRSTALLPLLRSSPAFVNSPPWHVLSFPSSVEISDLSSELANRLDTLRRAADDKKSKSSQITAEATIIEDGADIYSPGQSARSLILLGNSSGHSFSPKRSSSSSLRLSLSLSTTTAAASAAAASSPMPPAASQIDVPVIYTSRTPRDVPAAGTDSTHASTPARKSLSSGLSLFSRKFTPPSFSNPFSSQERKRRSIEARGSLHDSSSVEASVPIATDIAAAVTVTDSRSDSSGIVPPVHLQESVRRSSLPQFSDDEEDESDESSSLSSRPSLGSSVSARSSLSSPVLPNDHTPLSSLSPNTQLRKFLRTAAASESRLSTPLSGPSRTVSPVCYPTTATDSPSYDITGTGTGIVMSKELEDESDELLDETITDTVPVDGSGDQYGGDVQEGQDIGDNYTAAGVTSTAAAAASVDAVPEEAVTGNGNDNDNLEISAEDQSTADATSEKLSVVSDYTENMVSTKTVGHLSSGEELSSKVPSICCSETKDVEEGEEADNVSDNDGDIAEDPNQREEPQKMLPTVAKPRDEITPRKDDANEGDVKAARRGSDEKKKPAAAATEPPFYQRINVLGMQSDITAAFIDAFRDGKGAVGIHSMSPCPTCGHAMLDEELMAAWSGLGRRPTAQHVRAHSVAPPTMSPSSGDFAELASPILPDESSTPCTNPLETSIETDPPSANYLQTEGAAKHQQPSFNTATGTVSAHMKGTDIDAAHIVACPACLTPFIPQLSIRYYELREETEGSRSSSSNNNNSDTFSSPMLSISSINQAPSSSASKGSFPFPEASSFPSSSSAGAAAGHLPYTSTPSRTTSKSPSAASSSQQHSRHLQLAWSCSVPHLSPSGLRFALEEQMENIGERVVNPNWLHLHRPAVYWGIIWYTSRLQLPTGFLASSPAETTTYHFSSPDLRRIESFRYSHTPMSVRFVDLDFSLPPSEEGRTDAINLANLFKMPAIVGWRESAVKARVLDCLSPPPRPKYSSGFAGGSKLPTNQKQLKLSDIFPGVDTYDASSSVSAGAASGSVTPDHHAKTSAPTSPTTLSTPTTPIRATGGAPETPKREPGSKRNLLNSPLSAFFSLKSKQSPSGSSASPATVPVRSPSVLLDRAADFLDGTQEGMRRAMLEIGRYLRMPSCGLWGVESLSNRDNGCGGGSSSGIGIGHEEISEHKSSPTPSSHEIARAIYIILLTLANLYQRSALISSAESIPPALALTALTKASIFEKVYIDTIKNSLSGADMTALGTTEKDLLGCTAGTAAQAFRAGIGFIF